jgi:hypothetical protein
MKYLVRVIALFALLHASAYAQSEGSKAMSQGSMAIIMSPVLSLEGRPVEASAALLSGGTYVVVGFVHAAGETVALTIKNVANGSTYVVKGTIKAAQGASVAVGTSVRVAAESTGYTLMASGQLLSFIPNGIGQMLLHQSQVK